MLQYATLYGNIQTTNEINLLKIWKGKWIHVLGRQIQSLIEKRKGLLQKFKKLSSVRRVRLVTRVWGKATAVPRWSLNDGSPGSAWIIKLPGLSRLSVRQQAPVYAGAFILWYLSYLKGLLIFVILMVNLSLSIYNKTRTNVRKKRGGWLWKNTT